MTEEFAPEAGLAKVAERSRANRHVALVPRFAAADDIPPHATSKWSAPSGFRHRDNGSVVNVAPILGRARRGDGTARKGPSL